MSDARRLVSFPPSHQASLDSLCLLGAMYADILTFFNRISAQAAALCSYLSSARETLTLGDVYFIHFFFFYYLGSVKGPSSKHHII